MILRAPFPYFGGKSRVASLVWAALGDVPNYVEPFAGSLAILLQRPTPAKIETVNDLDGFICNAWRAIQADPVAVAEHANWPVSEADLHARHTWLLEQRDSLTERLVADPAYHDAKAAGWWVWGACCWIGSGWCRGDGPWKLIDGRLVDTGADARQLPHLGDAGRGIHRQLPHLGDAGQGIHRQLPHLGNAGRGIHRQLPHLGNAGRGIADYMDALSERLRRVRIACGDWSRVTGPSVTTRQGITGIVLDPPYALDGRTDGLYAHDTDVFDEVRQWAVANGDDSKLRIVLCGYEGPEMPATWRVHRWKARGGFGSQGEGIGRENSAREVLWFSPHCLVRQRTLFESDVQA